MGLFNNQRYKEWRGSTMGKITIQKLGPIKEIVLEEKQFNLFIGEQATGKSTAAKAIFFFKKMARIAKNYLIDLSENGEHKHIQGDTTTFYKATQRDIKDMFVSLFGYTKQLDSQLYLRYDYCEGIWIEVTVSKDTNKYLNTKYSPGLIAEMKKLTKEAMNFFEKNGQISDTQAFFKDKKIRIGNTLMVELMICSLIMRKRIIFQQEEVY